jgi:hypothetical protein
MPATLLAVASPTMVTDASSLYGPPKHNVRAQANLKAPAHYILRRTAYLYNNLP